MRDYEYKRLGTLSLLAAIDLLTGEAVPLVSETHKSSDFVSFLKLLDEKYPKGDKIRLILDNHSCHRQLAEIPLLLFFVGEPDASMTVTKPITAPPSTPFQLTRSGISGKN